MRNLMIISLLCCAIVAGACSKSDRSNASIEDIHKSEGVPIRVLEIEPQRFSQDLIYNATISGAEESTQSAMLADVVTAIHARVGDRVQRGQLIVSFPQNSPQAQNEQALTAYNSSRQVYERMQRLLAQGAISQQDFDNAKTGFDISAANLEASNSMIKVSAPIDGVITNIMINQGERTYPGQPLFTVAGGSGFKAIINVPEKDVNLIRRGSNVVAEWNEHKINGRISQIALALDPGTKAFRVEATFPASNRNISYGVTAQVRVVISQIENALVVDRQFIFHENGSPFVWLEEGGKAVKRAIETGKDNYLSFEVISGLSAGDKLIVEGMNLLTEDALIKLVP